MGCAGSLDVRFSKEYSGGQAGIGRLGHQDTNAYLPSIAEQVQNTDNEVSKERRSLSTRGLRYHSRLNDSAL